MAFKASTSKAPAAPATYKCEANRMYGIDGSTSDDNIALGRACGISYFDSEMSGGPPMPGMSNFIRTNHGEIAKRRGAKPVSVEWRTSVAKIHNVTALGNLTVLCTVDAEYGSAQTNFFDSIHFLKYSESDGTFTDTVLRVSEYDGGEGFNFATVTEIKSVFFINGAAVYVNTQDAAESDLSSAICVREADVTVASESDSGYFYFPASSDSLTYAEYEAAGVYTPTVYIGAVPAGGSGKEYEPANHINPWVCEMFRGDGSATKYTLSFGADTSAAPIAFIQNSSGGWAEASVSWADGKVTFSTAPGKPELEGEDNVKIYHRRANVTPDVITDCRIFCNFGVGGYKDRLFISGNASYPNYIWYSDMDDYGYFPDIGYITVADSACEVKALAGQDTYLAVITDDRCYLVSGTVNTSDSYAYTPDALFLIASTFESVPPAGFRRPLVFNNEIVYISTQGLVAITPSNIMDERYIQLRSERINGWLLKDELEEVQCCVCGEFFVINNRAGRLYLLDKTQYAATESVPSSYRQYEGFVWNITADFVWSINNDLFFCADNGIYRIPFDNTIDNEDFTDEIAGSSTPIACYFETPNICGSDFYTKKAFSKIGILLRKMINTSNGGEINTAVRVWAKRNNGDWKLFKDYDGDQSIFRYDCVNYSLFSYRDVGKRYAIDKKMKFKKTYVLKLRFENDIANMPLFLQAFGVEYSK